MLYSIAQQSHQGGRDYNEDRTAIFEREGAVLLVVADGLGGHAGGDLASQAFVDAMGDSFTRATGRQLLDAANFLKLSIKIILLNLVCKLSEQKQMNINKIEISPSPRHSHF